MKTKTNIRFAKEEDIHPLITLCEAHAHYEQTAYTPGDKSEKLREGLFSIPAKLYCLVVEKNTQLVGYATYMEQYATWDACSYIYMDCLYLEESSRGAGIGEQLVLRIGEEAKKLGCTLLQWQTPNFNTRAIKFYKRIGAVSKAKERFFLSL